MNLLEQAVLDSRDIATLIRRHLYSKSLDAALLEDATDAALTMLQEINERFLNSTITSEYALVMAAKFEALKASLMGESPGWSGGEPAQKEDDGEQDRQRQNEESNEDAKDSIEAKRKAQLRKAAGVLYRERPCDDDSILKGARRAKRGR